MNTIKVTANYTVVVPQDPTNVASRGLTLDCDSTAGAITITIPAISTFGNAPVFPIIINDAAGLSATNPITVAVNAADKVNNAASIVLAQTGGSISMNIASPTDWTAVLPGGGLFPITVTATSDGLTTGIIPNGNTFVAVTSAAAANIVVLPAPIPGTVVKLSVGANGYELRTSAPATVGINGGVGVAAESAIPANTFVVMECFSATNWIGSTYTSAGVKGVVEVAAP